MTQSATSSTWAQQSLLRELQGPAPVVDPAVTAAVSDVLHRYATAYDERRLDVLRECFTADLLFETYLRETLLARFSGANAALEGIASVMSEQGPQQRRHLIGNVIIDPVGPDEVHAFAYAAILLCEPTSVSVGASAAYRCRLERRPPEFEGWRLAGLTIGMDGYAGQAPERVTDDE